jgi:hypothetical protein
MVFNKLWTELSVYATPINIKVKLQCPKNESEAIVWEEATLLHTKLDKAWQC